MNVARSLILPLASIALLAPTTGLSRAAAGVAQSQQQRPLVVKIASFEVKDATISDAIAQLSSEPIPLSLGFEEVLRPRFSDPPGQSPRFTLTLTNKSVREVLDALCVRDKRYKWSADGPTVNIYPRATTDESDYLLNILVPHLAVESIDSPEGALKALDIALRGKQQLGFAQAGGDSRYVVPWSQTFTNMTVRQIMNRLSLHMGRQNGWIFYGGRDFRAFGFSKAGFQRSTPKAPG